MSEPSFFDKIMAGVDQVDKIARVLQRTDDLAHELATPAGGQVIDMGPDDTDDGEETREDSEP